MLMCLPEVPFGNQGGQIWNLCTYFCRALYIDSIAEMYSLVFGLAFDFSPVIHLMKMMMRRKRIFPISQAFQFRRFLTTTDRKRTSCLSNAVRLFYSDVIYFSKFSFFANVCTGMKYQLFIPGWSTGVVRCNIWGYVIVLLIIIIFITTWLSTHVAIHKVKNLVWNESRWTVEHVQGYCG